MAINEFGYDVADTIDEFFQKIIDWNNKEKPSLTCVKTAKKLVNMMVEKPICLSIDEDKILIDYECSNGIKILEVKDNYAEFLFYKN